MNSEIISSRFRNLALFSSFLVLLIHSISRFQVYNPWIRDSLYDGICRVAVPFFFFATGFFLCRHIGEQGWYRLELRKRIVSLGIPFIIWSCFYWALHNSRDVSVLEVFGLDLLKWPLLRPLWYIRGLFVLVAMSPVLIRLSSWGGLLFLYLLYGVIGPWEGLHGDAVFFFRKTIPLQGMFYFTLGMAVQRGSVRLYCSRRRGLSVLGVGGLILVVKVLLQVSGFLYYHYLGWLAIPLVLVGLVNVFPSKILPMSIVSCAFPIYLFHMFVLDIMFYIICISGVGPIGEKYIVWSIVTGSSFLITFFVVYLQRHIVPSLNAVLYGGR